MSTATHFFRLDPESFRAIAIDTQHAVVAQSSLGIELGDQLVFREWKTVMTRSVETGSYTGAWLVRQVSHVAQGGKGTGVDADHRVLSLKGAYESKTATVMLGRELLLAERQGVSPDRFWRIKERKERAHRPRVDDVTARLDEDEPLMEAGE